MIKVRKTSNVVSIGGAKGKTVSGASGSTAAPSPFSISPANPLKAITERQTKMNEWQRLAILQRALEPYAREARGQLPSNLQKIEKKVRRKMLEEGFTTESANEAGDEVVTALLGKKPA